jgi:hypothetical protein
VLKQILGLSEVPLQGRPRIYIASFLQGFVIVVLTVMLIGGLMGVLQ